MTNWAFADDLFKINYEERSETDLNHFPLFLHLPERT